MKIIPTIIPITICKNEEIWLSRILTPLAVVFQHVVVADTGSTDSTLAEIAKVNGVTLLQYPALSMDEVGRLRGVLQDVAKDLGATHVFLADGDELYPTKYLQFIHDNPMPENAPCGFTLGVEIGEMPDGKLWRYAAYKSRDAVFSVDTKWSGSYPFENHSSFSVNPELRYYWPREAGHFYHLHGCRRSSRDEDVYLRVEKQHQFNMNENADAYSKTLWLNSEKDYRDEALYGSCG